VMGVSTASLAEREAIKDSIMKLSSNVYDKDDFDHLLDEAKRR
jgi:hypothetical protein